MASFVPITLLGDNLGQRHRHLNSLVRQAKKSGASIQDEEALPEESPVDRLFKIDLAIELKHVDCIIRNLKDDDMLYVSRALKSTWLIDHRDIVNPKYLEDVLFPEMITPAVTKMKHWLYINLRDPAMCQEFYQHYKENTFEFAIKFLSHCSHEFILAETPKILTKLSTHSLKVLCEKCPRVAKMYFDSLATDEDVKIRYLRQDRSYYNIVKCVLKSDADVFLDITEKYFNMNSFSRFSPLATDYILRCHKTRFTNKLELYVAYFLHIPTLAARLSVEECQEVVLKLARASYLQHWFQYKVVEPLIKRLSPDKRAAFKKRVFVDKDVGDCEDKWPYELPAPPTLSDIGLHIFDDQDFMSSIAPIFPPRTPGGGMLFGAAAFPCAMQPQALNFMNMIKVKTDLDRLFDEFRFIGFERALHELGQRLVATGSTDRRRDIFLVLVSKTGGRTDAVSALLRLTARHSNEPPHTRASILRSLVKRAHVWRLPADVWQHLLDYGHGLGLDGTPPEAACREGLHAVVIRQLLAGECEEAVRDAFMKDFSTLVEYSLKVDERVRVANGLQNMLADVTVDVETAVAADRLRQLLDVLKIYRVRVEPTSPAVKAVVALALRDADVARPLLERLYNERIARRELLRFNMEFRRDEAALLNALRHDPSALEVKRVADMLAGGQCWQNYQRFAPRPTIPFSSFAAQSTNFGSCTAQPMIFGNSAAPPTSFKYGISVAQPTNLVSSTAPPTGFSFGSPDAQPTSFSFGSSTAQPTDLGSSTASPTGISFGSSAAQPTGFSFDSSTAEPTGLGNPAAQPTGFSFGNSAAQLTGFSFGTSAAQSTNLVTSTAPPTGFSFGNSAAQPTGFSFGSSTSQPTDLGSSTAPLTGISFGSSAAQPTGLGSLDAQLTGSSFDSSAAQPTGFNFGNSTALPWDLGSSTAPPMGISFGNSAAQPKVLGIPAAQPTGFSFDSSTAQPTGFSFDSSTAQPTGLGNPVAQPTGFSFGNPAAQPTGFSFGTSAAQSPNVVTSTAPPTGFSFDNSAAQPIDLGNLITQTPVPGSFSDQLTVCRSSPVLDSSANQPKVFGSSDDLPLIFGSSDTTTVFGDSAAHPTVIGSSAVPSTSFFSSFANQPTVSGSFANQPTVSGSSLTQPMVFGSASVQPMGFRNFPPPRYPYRHFRRFAARQPSFNMFTSKLVVYFDYKQDFTTNLRTALKEKLTHGQYVKLARPLAILCGNNFEKELRDADVAGKERVKFAAALRACAHRARPVVNLAEWGWRKAGVKAVATRAMRCREIERPGLTRALATERRTVRVALALSLRSASGLFLGTIESAAKLRPVVALRVALPYFRRHGDSSDLRVWDIIKPLLCSVNLGERLRHILGNIDWIPSTIKSDYCITLYLALHKISTYNSQIVLRDLSKLLPECDESIENILLQMLDSDDADKDISAISYPTIFVRYLLLSRNEEDVEKRFVKIGNRFLERLDTLRCENDYNFQRLLHQILKSLMYNSAFLDSQFSSCLSVIERVLAWLQKFMPKEKYFKTNTQVHLTMLYYKAVRQSMKQMPEVFADPKRKKSEGIEAVGFVFGRCIVKEVAELVSTYFDSITELYTDALVDYLNHNLAYGSSKNKFIGVALKGILTEAVGIQRRMAVYVLREHHICLEDSVRKEIEELIMKDQAIQIIAHDGLFDQAVPVVPYFHNFRIRN